VAVFDASGRAAAQGYGATHISASLGSVTATSTFVVDPLALHGTGPLRVHPTNRRYMTNDGGRAIYLTGSHTWTNFIDSGLTDPPPAFDYGVFLSWLRSRNHNFFRLYVWEQARWTAETTRDYWFSPHAFQRTGPGEALDAKPRFDLTKLDQAYFDRLRQRVILAGEQGLYVAVMLFDGWSIADKSQGEGNPWPGHPFHARNNINGINGDPRGTGQGKVVHTLGIRAITAIQDAYVRKVIDTVNDLDNITYEISNESDGSAEAVRWQYRMITLIQDYERSKPKRHPVGMTALYPDGNDGDLYRSAADWISPHAGGNISDPEPAKGRKVIIYDTDHLCGNCGDAPWAWKSFMRGLNPILMDAYDGTAIGLGASSRNARDPIWESIRRSMGQTLAFARRINLAVMTPRGDLCSSGYMLANVTNSNAEYLAYLPSGGRLRVDLAPSTGVLWVEWFSVTSGVTIAGGTIAGGVTRTFVSPFSDGEAVLYIHR